MLAWSSRSRWVARRFSAASASGVNAGFCHHRRHCSRATARGQRRRLSPPAQACLPRRAAPHAQPPSPAGAHQPKTQGNDILTASHADVGRKSQPNPTVARIASVRLVTLSAFKTAVTWFRTVGSARSKDRACKGTLNWRAPVRVKEGCCLSSRQPRSATATQTRPCQATPPRLRQRARSCWRRCCGPRHGTRRAPQPNAPVCAVALCARRRCSRARTPSAVRVAGVAPMAARQWGACRSTDALGVLH